MDDAVSVYGLLPPVVNEQPENVATPSVNRPGVVVHENPPPLAVSASEVVESEDTTVPLSSSSAMVTLKVLPAWTVVGGDA